ncbi:MAG TPA: biotin/lipoyl-containing protein, partial [Gemmatimonadales bacterium]|nr:biotin/lipoyl-containing protein [Gemmatimonadales bacterium]
MARVDVLMPQMGESIAEGTLSKWLKKVGDEVKRDEPLFEISTDKVDAEIPAPTAGVLAEIKVQEGQTVPVQTLVAVIETDKGAATTAATASTAAPSAAAQRAPAASGAAVAAAASPPPLPSPPPPPTAPDRPRPPLTAPVTAGKSGDGAETAEERLRKKSTPLVRKIAAEHRVDIATIPGTGFAGRVTKQDILGYIDRAPVPAGAPPIPETRHPTPAVEPWPGDRVEPMSKIRKITADHMVMSRRVSAHVTSYFEVDYTRVAELRRKHKQSYAERGANLTFLGFIAKACAENLRKHAVVNA